MSGTSTPNLAMGTILHPAVDNAGLEGPSSGMNAGSSSPGIGINTGEYDPKLQDWRPENVLGVSGYLGWGGDSNTPGQTQQMVLAPAKYATADYLGNVAFLQVLGGDVAAGGEINGSGFFNSTGATLPEGARLWATSPS